MVWYRLTGLIRKGYSTHRGILSFVFLASLATTLVLNWGKHSTITERNIILISIDTLRADHLSLYGYEKVTDPFLRAFGEQGTVFEHCYAHVPRTLPSHATLFLSRHYSAHRIAQTLERDSRIAPGTRTLASHLKDAGYQTAAFTDGGWMVRELGLSEGFEEFRQSSGIDVPSDARDYLPGFENISSAALGWLDERELRPFFLFLHCYDVHDYFTDLPRRMKMIMELYQKERNAEEGEIERIVEAYDNRIASFDGLFKSFVIDLRQRGLLENTLLVILSDHGEGFGEHGSFVHGDNLYQESVHVPCILSGPDIPKGVRVPYPVGLIDIFPTICQWAGVQEPTSVQGSSILPFVEAVVQSQSRAYSPVFLEIDRPDSSRALISWPMKLLTWHAKPSELYDLVDDPREQADLYESQGASERELLKQLHSTVSASVAFPPSDAPAALSEELTDRLKDLGYTR